jgi:hypothetical protein
MKVGGVEVSPCEELLVLPRSNGSDIPFRARAVSISKEFNEKVPMPVAPMLQTKDGNKHDFKDPAYKAALQRRDEQRFALMCLRSLEPSNIEWETVDIDDPGTWLNWDVELKAAGISDVEGQRIINLVMAANSLDEKKVEEARQAFLLGQVA